MDYRIFHNLIECIQRTLSFTFIKNKKTGSSQLTHTKKIISQKKSIETNHFTNKKLHQQQSKVLKRSLLATLLLQ